MGCVGALDGLALDAGPVSLGGGGCGVEIIVEGGGKRNVRIDDADHAALTVGDLRAVEPDWIGVVDG